VKNSVPEITITKALTTDAQNIRKLEELVWQEEVTNKYDAPMLVRFGYVYVAWNEKILVGAIVAFKTNKNEIYVSDVVVHPKYQGMKIGERLYRKLLQATKGTDVVSFLDPELIPTLNLHKKLGGKIVSKVVNPYDLNKGLETGTRLFVRIANKKLKKGSMTSLKIKN
jgi:ribosomal protein S18 acetylase RimI-like enzyme